MARLTQCFLRRSRRLTSSAEKDSGTKSPTHIPDVIVLRVMESLKCFKEFYEKPVEPPQSSAGQFRSPATQSCRNDSSPSKTSSRRSSCAIRRQNRTRTITSLLQSRSSPQSRSALICNLSPNSMSWIKELLSLQNRLMNVGICLPHNSLQGPVEIAECNIARD